MRGRKMYVWPTNKQSLMVFIWDLFLTLFIVFWVFVLLGMLFGCSGPSATEGMPPVIEGESGVDVELTQVDICTGDGGYGCFILVPLPGSHECHFVLVDEVPNIVDELGELGIETNATIEDLRCRGDITDMFLNSCWSEPQSANTTWTFTNQTAYFLINDGEDPMVFSATNGRVTIPNTVEHSICQQ